MDCTPPNGRRPRPVLTDPAYELIANFFKVLADPLRIRLLNAMHDGEQSVMQLMALTGGNQANVSKHLKVLLEAGLVERRKEGTNAFYKVQDPLVFTLCESVCDRQQTFLEARASLFREQA